MGRCRHTHTHAGRQVGTLALPQALSSLQANPNPCLRIIFPSELYIVEVLRKEFGKNTEVALENVFGVLLPSEKGSLKASPVLPSQHNRSPRDAPSCPGNVLPGHAVSSSPSTSPSCWDWPPLLPRPSSSARRHSSRWGPGQSQKDQHQRAGPSCHPVFGGAQLPAAAAAVNSEYGLDIRAKTHSVKLSQAAPRAVVDLFSSCTIESLPEANELKLERMQS